MKMLKNILITLVCFCSICAFEKLAYGATTPEQIIDQCEQMIAFHHNTIDVLLNKRGKITAADGGQLAQLCAQSIPTKKLHEYGTINSSGELRIKFTNSQLDDYIQNTSRIARYIPAKKLSKKYQTDSYVNLQK